MMIEVVKRLCKVAKKSKWKGRKQISRQRKWTARKINFLSSDSSAGVCNYSFLPLILSSNPRLCLENDGCNED